MTTRSIDFFPAIKGTSYPPSKLQAVVLDAVDKAISDGKKYIIIEAPVGSGKSADAIAIARSFGDAHIITPRK